MRCVVVWAGIPSSGGYLHLRQQCQLQFSYATFDFERLRCQQFSAAYTASSLWTFWTGIGAHLCDQNLAGKIFAAGSMLSEFPALFPSQVLMSIEGKMMACRVCLLQSIVKRVLLLTSEM